MDSVNSFLTKTELKMFHFRAHCDIKIHLSDVKLKEYIKHDLEDYQGRRWK